MEPFDRGTFENEWAEAFEGAELAPSAGLWDSIDMTLSGQEGILYRKRFVAMRWVAAAAVILALLFGGMGYYFWNTNQLLEARLSENNDPGLNAPANEGLALSEEPKTVEPSDNNPIIQSREELNSNEEFSSNTKASSIEELMPNEEVPSSDEMRSNEEVRTNQKVTPDNTVNSIAINEETDNSQSQIISDDRESTKNNAIAENVVKADSDNNSGISRTSILINNTVNEDRIRRSLAGITGDQREGDNIFSNRVLGKSFMRIGYDDSQLDKAYSLSFTGVKFDEIDMIKVPVISIDFDDEEDFEKNTWAGVQLAGGAYNPEASTGGFGLSFAQAESDFAATANQTNSESVIRGNTRGYGLRVGTTLSKKFLFKSGLQFASVTSGTYVGSDASFYSSANDLSLQASRANFNNSTSPNSALVIDTYNFLSVPLEAGYYLLNGRFSISLNPGIDSRFYLNTRSERYVSGNPDRESLVSDINPVTFWGQIGTDISYRLNDRYHIVVSPGYKFALNSLETGSGVYPALSEVAFSMHYIFDN